MNDSNNSADNDSTNDIKDNVEITQSDEDIKQDDEDIEQNDEDIKQNDEDKEEGDEDKEKSDEDKEPNVIQDDKLTDTIPIYKSKLTKKILLLSGGGIKGIAHLGALYGLEKRGYLKKFETFVGSSVGALILAMHLVGYTPSELYKFVMKFEMHRVKSINAFNFLQVFGLDSGTRITYVLKRLIEAKTNNPTMTLQDLYKLTGKKLILTTVCMNTMEACYLSYETHPDLPLYLAIRMSISIPLFYTPVRYNDKLYIDGGAIDNYPIQLFEDSLDDVLGVYLAESHDVLETIDNVEIYLHRVIQCLMEGVTFNSKKGYDKYTINIKLENINFVDFSINSKKKRKMFKQGYNVVKKYFDSQ